jgi:hypothetical protein
MNVAEIKNDLHRMVVETNDPAILEQIAALFASLRAEKNWWDTISEQEKALIEKGRQDMAEGKTAPRSEVRQQVRQILSK